MPGSVYPVSGRTVPSRDSCIRQRVLFPPSVSKRVNRNDKRSFVTTSRCLVRDIPDVVGFGLLLGTKCQFLHLLQDFYNGIVLSIIKSTQSHMRVPITSHDCYCVFSLLTPS